jgi:hypothetical protein
MTITNMLLVDMASNLRILCVLGGEQFLSTGADEGVDLASFIHETVVTFPLPPFAVGGVGSVTVYHVSRRELNVTTSIMVSDTSKVREQDGKMCRWKRMGVGLGVGW